MIFSNIDYQSLSLIYYGLLFISCSLVLMSMNILYLIPVLSIISIMYMKYRDKQMVYSCPPNMK